LVGPIVAMGRTTFHTLEARVTDELFAGLGSRAITGRALRRLWCFPRCFH
jgi:hypothetical protein